MHKWGGEIVPENNNYPHSYGSARVIMVIETVTICGSGTPDQPVQALAEYWSLSGEKLAEARPND